MRTTEQLGRCILRQEPGVFPLGADSLDLGRFATVRRGWRVCDLGCGSGVLGLLLWERQEGLELTAVDKDPEAVRLAALNFRENSVTGQVRQGDLRDRDLLPAEGFDLCVSNPPWFAVGAGRSGGPARSEEGCALDQLCAAAGRLLRNGGRFALVHRPERLAELFAALTGAGLEPKRLQLVQHGPDKAPSAVLVESVKGGRPGLEVLPALLRQGPVLGRDLEER